MKKGTKIAALVFSAIFILGLAAPVMTSTFSTLNTGILFAAYNFGTQGNNPMQSKQNEVNMTILFHSDLHSELLPWPLADYNATSTNDDPTVGGMARIATIIDETRDAKELVREPVLVFMDGDFLMGTPFEWLGGATIGQTSLELLLMSAAYLDYTAICLGNHEFDYSDHGLSQILNNTNATLGGNMPLILCSNLNMTNDVFNLGAFITPNATMIVDGVKIGLFSVIGYGASGTMFFTGSTYGRYHILDPITTAQEQVAYFQADPDIDLIICLSHSGWAEDMALASQVDGIDLILAGHDHNLLTTPIVVNTLSGTTTIVDAEALGEYLGYLEMQVNANNNSGQGITVRKYAPIHINDTIAEDPPIAGVIGAYTAGLNTFLQGITGLPLTIDSVIANTTADVTSTPGETAIGDLVADAIRWQLWNSSGDYKDISFVPSGVIRHGFSSQSGNITLYDAISVVPLGGVPYQGPYLGWFLCNFSVYGYEIKNALEFSILMGGDFFLQVSGLRFWYSPLLAPGDQVVRVDILTQDGGWTALDDNQLYSVVVNLEAALLIPEVGALYPFPLLEPRFPNGTAINTSDTLGYLGAVLYGYPRSPIPEWTALVQYLAIEQAGEVDSIYHSTQGRINVWHIDPAGLFTLTGLGQLIAGQQAGSNLVLGGIAGLLLIMIVAAAIIASRRP
ncbi:MAG: bifunctional UDP-sugar hydrolase/5'-nucleotidase [Candidatus Lokiarchaeia archaeon]